MADALMEQKKFGWQDTWPVQLAKNALSAFALPGQVAGGVMDAQPCFQFCRNGGSVGSARQLLKAADDLHEQDFPGDIAGIGS